MTDNTPDRDAAWVTIDTPLPAEVLLTLCRDPERLLRINSMYEFSAWRHTAPDEYVMRLLNHATGGMMDTALSVTTDTDGMVIRYASGLKTATTVRVEPMEAGSRLTLIDEYSRATEEERLARIDEVDRSLTQWGHDLHHYFRHWHRWSRFAPWRWYMRRVWQPMRPSARRITFMLLAVSLFEIAAFIGIIAVFAAEQHRAG